MRADVLDGLFHHLRVGVVGTATPAVLFLPGRRVEDPLMKVLAALAETLVGVMFGPATYPSRDIVMSKVSRAMLVSNRWFQCVGPARRARLIAVA